MLFLPEKHIYASFIRTLFRFCLIKITCSANITKLSEEQSDVAFLVHQLHTGLLQAKSAKVRKAAFHELKETQRKMPSVHLF